jgi:hypothetical protein
MSFELRYAAALLIVAGASITLAPLAVGDPPSIPEPGTESAVATIRDLDSAGYDVQLQYENGVPNVPLSQCTVTDINTTGSAGSQGLAYVTINCNK